MVGREVFNVGNEKNDSEHGKECRAIKMGPEKGGQRVTRDASLCCGKQKIITKDGDQVQIS